MTREEYESAKEILLGKRHEILQDLEELRRKYESQDIEQLNIKYIGKYLVEYDRTYNNDNEKVCDFNRLHIIKVNKVGFRGNGFIRVHGDVYYVNCMADDTDVQFWSLKDHEYDIYNVDEIHDDSEAQALMKIYVERITNSIKNFEAAFSHK